MRPAFATVLVKELTDAARDRRTALMLLVVSVLVGPLTFALLVHFVSGLEKKAQTREVHIHGAAHAPALVNFLERNDVRILAAPEDYEARVRKGSLDAVIVVPDDFQEHWLSGDGARVEIVYDDSRTDAAPATRQVERLLEAFNRETGMLRMIARGVSPDLADPVKVERVNTATPRQQGASLLFLIPMFVLLSPLLGGMTVAIDSTAGERERGSLEPLLANPVPLAQVVAGKWLAAWIFAIGVSVLTLAGFAVAAAFNAHSRLAAAVSFGLPELAGFLSIVVPFAAMTSAAQLLISTYGRSYREAQTYVSYLTAAVSFVPALVLFSGLKDAHWELAVPVLGQQAVMLRILRGDPYAAWEWAVLAAIAGVLAALALAAVTRLLRDERVVFGRS